MGRISPGLLVLICSVAIVNAAVVPQITDIGLATGRIRLSWAGTSAACDIQSAAGPSVQPWTTVLHTSRTNATVPLTGNSGFFRVVASDPAASSLIMTITNVSSGDIYTLARQPQTNSDLLFDNLGDTNAVVPVRTVLPAAERQKFDIAFDGTGGFTIVNTNGQPGGAGGLMNSVAGPGANQITYSGYVTNGTDTILFSSISGPAPAKPGVQPLDTGNASAGGPGDVASGVWTSLGCSAAWAGQNLGCSAAAFGRTLGCVGFFPPKASTGYGYITNRTGINLVVTSTNLYFTGTCDSKCITCCKDLGTGALSNCQ